MKKIILILLIFVLSGCVETIETEEDFHRLTSYRGMGHFYYIGTEDNFHYFASDYFLGRTKYYSYPVEKFEIINTFPKTNNKNDWKPFLVDINENTAGFKDEHLEKIKGTNEGIKHK